MKFVYWLIAILVLWLILDPRGLAGTLYAIGHGLAVVQNSYNH